MLSRKTKHVGIRMALAALLGAGVLLSQATARADSFWPVPFAYNDSLYGLPGNPFPTGNPVVLGGVPFRIPSDGPNIWSSTTATDGFPGNPGTVSLQIPIFQRGVDGVHTLINSDYGQPGPLYYAYLAFVYDDGRLVYYKPLVGNSDIRSRFSHAGGTQQINNTTTTNVWIASYSPDHVTLSYYQDKQFVDLSPYRTHTLDYAYLVDFGGPNFQRTYLAGLTVQKYEPPASGG